MKTICFSNTDIKCKIKKFIKLIFLYINLIWYINILKIIKNKVFQKNNCNRIYQKNFLYK